jgi:hypothetical protein
MVTRKNRKSRKTSKGFRNKKVRKTRSKRQRGGDGKRTLNGNDKKFLEEKQKNLEERRNTNIHFNLYQEPERPNKGIPAHFYTDPDGVIERQAIFSKDMDNEADYDEMEKGGLTIGGKKTKKSKKSKMKR